MLTGVEHEREVPVTQEQLDRWRMSGRLIQWELPSLSVGDREFIMSGITPEEWAAEFGSDDGDGEDTASETGHSP